MGRFLLKCLAYAAALVALVAVYVYGCDPLRVMRWHSDYYSDGIITNIGVAGVENFEHNPDRRRFDSFILGSSVSKNLLADGWRRHLTDSARIYHLASDEQIVPETRLMLEYASRQVDSMRHVIVMATPWSMKERYEKGAAGALPAAVYPDALARWQRHRDFVAWSLSRQVAAARIGNALTGRVAAKYKSWLDVRPGSRYDSATNELLISGMASDNTPLSAELRAQISKTCSEYRLSVADPLITPGLEAELRAMAEVARRSGATLDFVLIGDEVPCVRDDSLLHEIFGRGYHNMTTAFVAERRQPSNYYDAWHVFPELTTRIVDAALSASE
ncbi:MAG: hypothetical protein NC406_09640 [Bacteroides sp.]|nr:hypothetical protein [Bacteroides sp.]MCM1096079.1 hypothetical protein [Terasakiella sp.]